MSQTATMTETAPEPQSKSISNPMLFNLETKNETLFKIKQISTGVHFISLIVLGCLYIMSHDQTFNCFCVAATAMLLAIFIPPTGMIGTKDAPEYAKNSMKYMPDRQLHLGEAGPFGEKETKKAKVKTTGNPKKKNKSS